MLRKILDSSVIWLLSLPLMLLVIFYFLDSDGRHKLLQLLAMFWGWASFHLFFKIISDRLQSKVVTKEQMKNRRGFIISKTYVYIAVIASVFLFFSFMNYLSKTLLLTILVFDLIVRVTKLIRHRIKKPQST